MALRATVFKAELQISDMDRGYYETHKLTVARHPSETDERMMLRLVAFAANASEHLQFTRGLSTDDEPDIWEMALDGAISLWIELGLPDERRVRKACQRANHVKLYIYGSRGVPVWWQQNKDALARYKALEVISVAKESSDRLTKLAERTMAFSVTIQDGQLWISDGQDTIEVVMETLKETSE